MTHFTTATIASVPDNFAEILRDLSRAVLRAQPANVKAFCAEYFSQKIHERKGRYY